MHPNGYQTPIYNRAGHCQLSRVANAITFPNLLTKRWETENLYRVGIELQEQPVRYIINVYAGTNTMSETVWLSR